jgi:branched-chain amino acid aminotransferase
MKASEKASEMGYNQVLWLFGDEVTEVGAMNVFFLIENPNTNREELITPPLSRGDILPGVTRRSILELELARGDLVVSERSITMPEILKAQQEGRLKEAFGTGTAAVISPISCIQWKNSDIDIEAPGPVSQRLLHELNDIYYGKVEGPEGWSVVL